jgi:hypothetical protein
MGKNIVTYNQLGRYGRLANQMFQIAGTIGIARKNGFDYAFPYWKNYDHAERFGSTEDIDIQKYFENPLPLYNGPALPDQFVHWGYQDVKLKNSCSLSGHMQSFKYFAHCFDEVKYYFRMKDEYPQNDYCAIHVRLGDYDNAYHPRLDMSYYAEAISQFPEETKFLVFSDDIIAVTIMFKNYYSALPKVRHFKFVQSQGYIDDFKLMKSCRHFIIGNSSYSAMAAILGEAKDKRVIAPAPWFGPKHTDITAKDIYCDDWIVINYEGRQFTQVDTSTNAYMGNKKPA